jgi:hypothetical protein
MDTATDADWMKEGYVKDANDVHCPTPPRAPMKRMFRPRNGGESPEEYEAQKKIYEKTAKRADSRGAAIISMMKKPTITDDDSEGQPYMK